MFALFRLPYRLGMFLALLAALGLLGGFCAPLVQADEGEEEEEAEEDECPLGEAEADQAKQLIADLNKVAKKKNATEVLPHLEALEELNHPSFEKTLIKLLKHPSSLVAVKVAEMWEWRVTPKNVKKVWKASWGEKKNARRYKVKTLVLRALARAKHTLDKRQYGEVVRDWRGMIGAPAEAHGEAMADICWYFEFTKDKRHCRWLAEELDYQYANVDASNPATPPAETQERRWKMWQHSKTAAVSALQAITGKEFDKTEEAKAWFKANQKTFGFKW